MTPPPPYDVDLDVQLLRRTAEGDRAAFDALVRRHAGAVLRLGRAICGDVGLAEDAAQQAFLDAFRNAHRFRGEASPRTWLLTIARNAALKLRGRQQRETPRAAPLDELGTAAGWGSADPEALTLLAERRVLLEDALNSLSPSDREILVLRDIEQLSGAETASMLGLQLRAMKSRLHRARLRLAAALRAMSEGGEDL